MSSDFIHPGLDQPKTTALLDTHRELETLKLIDRRQEQLLEDLDSLNARIENIIELYQHNHRPTDDKSDRPQDAAA